MSSNFNSQNKQSLKTKKKNKTHQKKTLNITLKPENQGQSLRLTNIKQHMIDHSSSQPPVCKTGNQEGLRLSGMS